ncbi:hypothetical protein J3R83DRAFT_8136 [Lanmaoa asiatica]|nr:hypothetical protein J3R83DRAFT_8136 [Lanmaoa asiatica]
MDHCYPSIEQIVEKVKTVREESREPLEYLYIMTNGDASWVADLKVALRDLGGWGHIGSNRDLSLTWEQKFVAQALDMLVAQRAQVFIGNGEPTKEQLLHLFFSIPEVPITSPPTNGDKHSAPEVERMDINAVLSFGEHGVEDTYIASQFGSPYLCRPYDAWSDSMLGHGVYALSLSTWHGMKIIVQLTSLRPTADAFCALLREALKAELQRGQMKVVKGFVKTCYSEALISTTSSVADHEREDGSLIAETKEGSPPPEADFHGGLGLRFRFPGDPKKLREASKIKLWTTYLRTHGRNLTLLRYPQCTRLVQVGLPNRLRGEIWETLSGSLYLRYTNPGLYAQLVEDIKGKQSTSLEDIEKDLHRSLPEYAGYQSEEGISALRRVLQAYSFKNPEVGYCQASHYISSGRFSCMYRGLRFPHLSSSRNSSYMSEEQTFWILEVLCDRLLPGYYSPTMHGTLLDQRVFESLVVRCLPMIHDHFSVVDVQLSVASLPWFLSLYINSMPMVFAFRIVDCFFCMGPKVLFQVGYDFSRRLWWSLLLTPPQTRSVHFILFGSPLMFSLHFIAILKINGEKLLQIQDDGGFLNLMREYFASLGESAHPDSSDPRARAITRFQELLLVSFREFAVITDETILSERRKYRNEIVNNIETFSRRSTVRNLKTLARFTKEQAGLIYDALYKAMFIEPPPPAVAPPPSLLVSTDSTQERPETRIGLKTFRVFLSEILTWARDEKIVLNGFQQRIDRDIAEHELIDRLFYFWDTACKGSLSFQDLVYGLDGVMFNDLMDNIEWFFNLHDKNKDGYLTKDEVLTLSESFLFIFRHEIGDAYLGAVSRFMTNAFEYGDTLLPQTTNSETGKTEPQQIGHNQPYLNLATFRMVVLADEILESFFETDLSGSFKLESVPDLELPTSGGGFLEDLWSNIATEDNKKIFHKISDELGKTIGKHQIIYRPTIGRFTKLEEPKAREPLVSSVSQSTFGSNSSDTLSTSQGSSSTLAINAMAAQDSGGPGLALSSVFSPLPHVKAVNAAFMERTPFAIDDAGDDDDSDLDMVHGEDDDQVMDEVDAFLEAHDSGLTDADKEAAKDLLNAKPV